MDSTPQDVSPLDRLPEDALPDDALPDDAPPEDAPPPIPFYQRPAFKKAFVVGLVIAVWVLIGLIFTPAYFRF